MNGWVFRTPDDYSRIFFKCRVYSAMHVLILQCDARSDSTVRCMFWFYSAMHVLILQCDARSDSTLQCMFGFYSAVHVRILQCGARSSNLILYSSLGETLVEALRRSCWISKNIFEYYFNIMHGTMVGTEAEFKRRWRGCQIQCLFQWRQLEGLAVPSPPPKIRSW